MENHSWSTISASASAAYINGALVPAGGHAEQYFTPPSLHPSEPNYIWLEAGDNLGITDDSDPSANHKPITDHFVSQLEKAGISWKAYVEDIPGTGCPLVSSGLYSANHVGQIFFDDVTNTNSAQSAYCIQHVRPYTELAQDLQRGTVARFNFITPNICNNMQGQSFGNTCNSFLTDMIKKGDDWLAAEVPTILASNAYKNDGALFVLWDEGDVSTQGASDGPLPFLVLSPRAKKNYRNSIAYTHSSTLRTLEEIAGVPLLRDANNATNLADFFTSYP
jgi:hypothetical protein